MAFRNRIKKSNIIMKYISLCIEQSPAKVFAGGAFYKLIILKHYIIQTYLFFSFILWQKLASEFKLTFFFLYYRIKYHSAEEGHKCRRTGKSANNKRGNFINKSRIYKGYKHQRNKERHNKNYQYRRKDREEVERLIIINSF